METERRVLAKHWLGLGAGHGWPPRGAGTVPAEAGRKGADFDSEPVSSFSEEVGECLEAALLAFPTKLKEWSIQRTKGKHLLQERTVLMEKPAHLSEETE